MDIDIVRDQWQQIRGLAKSWWGSLSDADLDGIDGNINRLIDKIEERYGFSKDRAAQDVYVRLKDMERQSLKSQNAQEAADQLKILESQNVNFQWIDIDQDQQAEKFVIRTNRGFRSVPTIIFEDGSILVEPSQSELQSKLITLIQLNENKSP